MKSGMAAMVMAAGMLAREKVQMRGDLIVAGLAGEEVDSLGAKSFAASGGLGGIGAIVVGEPTNLEVATAHKGALWLEITTLGKMAHGAMPELGVNAIVQMQLLLRKLLDYQPSYRPHSFLGPPTMNVGTIHGGVKTNMVPDRCVATIDLRTLPGQSHKQVVQEIGDISAGLGREVPGFRAKIGVIIDRPSVDTPVDEPLVQAALHVAKKVLGRDSGPRGKGYFTDASILTPASGAPTIIFGPGSDQLAHKVDEYVKIDQVFAAMEFFAHLARKVLS